MVCREIDMFIVNNIIWIAQLSNGETIYQDDNRPGYDEPNAWLRLNSYVNDNKLNITGLGIRFKTNYVWTEPNKDGYFFAKVASASWGDDKTDHYYKIGYLEGETIQTFQYRVPELILFDSSSKSIPDCIPGTLIINGQKTN